jgi:hypothetical protein
MALRRTSAQALSALKPFIVPLQTTFSRCLLPPSHVPFRFRRWRSRCCAAADGRVGCADPRHVTPGRVAAATVSVADATGLRRKNLATIRRRLLPAGSGSYGPDFPKGYRHDESWGNASRPCLQLCAAPEVRLSALKSQGYWLVPERYWPVSEPGKPFSLNEYQPVSLVLGSTLPRGGVSRVCPSGPLSQPLRSSEGGTPATAIVVWGADSRLTQLRRKFARWERACG